MHNKLNELKRILRECGRVTVAFSSGVDSTFLLKVARDTLGKDNVLAVTIASVFIPEGELMEASSFCKEIDVNHKVLKVDVLQITSVSKNPVDRCYLCKKSIFSEIIKLSKEYWQDSDFAVLEGSNVDDLSDYRPGMKAISELSVNSPLKEAMLTKSEIRALSKELGLVTWDKPSFACLASRFVYGEDITEKKLKMVELSENFLSSKGFRQYRVRIHGNGPEYIAKIELPKEDIEKLFDGDKSEILSDKGNVLAAEICDKLRVLGFSEILIDLKGYRTGSMNEAINGKI